MEEANPALKAAVLEAVDNQLRDNDPPEAKRAYKRLRRKGYSHQEARELIAATLLAEMYFMLKHGREHDKEKYINDLNQLPQPPQD